MANLRKLLREARLQGGGQMGCSGELMEALVQVAREAQVFIYYNSHSRSCDDLKRTLTRLRKVKESA